MEPKEIVKYADSLSPFPLFEYVKKIWRRYNENTFLNVLRRRRDYTIGYVASRRWTEPKKLHLGCGHNSFDSFINSDYIRTEATDYVLDARNLPFPDDSINRIETYHMLEHLPKPELDDMLVEWFRVLCPGGKLVVEVPDFDGVVDTYRDEEDSEQVELLLKYVFGSQRFQSDFHYWGWNFERLQEKLRSVGYVNIEREPAQDYHAEEAPCLRVEAEKPGQERSS